MAYSIFWNSVGDDRGPLACENVIIFLTDGKSNEGATKEDLYKIINKIYIIIIHFFN